MKKNYNQIFNTSIKDDFYKSIIRKVLPILIILITFSNFTFANGGIGYKGIYINNKGTKTWYKAHDVTWSYNGCGNYQFYSAANFDSQNFGSFTSTETLQIAGFAVVGWTDGSDWVAGKLLYKVWNQDNPEPETWSEIYIGNYGNGNGASQVVCSSSNDRVVGYDNGITNINPGAPGTYNFKIQALGRMQWSGGFFNVNDGSEVTATFTITSSVTDQFRSRATGNWNTVESWESSSNGTNWSTSTLVPGAEASSITIITGHTITLDSNPTIKSLTINSGGNFTASDETLRTLTIAKSVAGSSTTLSNSGTWSNGTGGSTVVFTGAPSGGDAVHAISGTIGFQNITINKTGGSSNVGASFGASSSLAETLEIGSGGYISSEPPASYYGPTAILKFNQGSGATYDVNATDNSWSTTEVPNYITVSSGTVNLNAARIATGNLIIDGGVLSLKSDASLTIGGNLTNAVGASGLVINSDQTNTGSLIINGTVSGNATIERYIGAWGTAAQGWHFLSSPVAGQSFQPEFVPNPPTVNEDFYLWDEPGSQWVNSKSGSGPFTFNEGAFGTTFVTGKGYLVSYASNFTKNFVGVPNTSSVSDIALTYTPASAAKGWNLLGNPFPSGLTWNVTAWKPGNTTISGTAKIVKSADASYEDITAGEVIPAMNGFFVYTSASTTLTIPAGSRTHGSDWFKQTSTLSKFILKVIDLDGQTAQKTQLILNPDASAGFDFLYDSEFLPFLAPSLYTVVEGKQLSTNSIPAITGNLLVPVHFVKNNGSNFVLEAENVSAFGTEINLVDKKTGIVTNLNQNPTYSFTSENSDDPARFDLHFGLVGLSEQTQSTQLKAYASNGRLYFPLKGDATLEVIDLQGRKLTQTKMSGTGLTSHPMSLTAGAYIVRLRSETGIQTAKVIVK